MRARREWRQTIKQRDTPAATLTRLMQNPRLDERGRKQVKDPACFGWLGEVQIAARLRAMDGMSSVRWLEGHVTWTFEPSTPEERRRLAGAVRDGTLGRVAVRGSGGGLPNDCLLYTSDAADE